MNNTPPPGAILVTAAGGDIGADILRCLRESGRPARLLACDTDRYAMGQEAADRFFVCPPAAEEAGYLAFLERLAGTEGGLTVIPSSEVELAVLDRNRERLAGLGAVLMMQSSAVLRTFMDKLRTALYLRENGLPAPASAAAGDFKGEFPFPLILKPRAGRGSSQVQLIRTPEELAFHRARVPDGVIQECVGSAEEEYTAGVFSDGAGTRSILFRRRLGYGGLSRQATLVATPPDLAALLERLSGLIGLKGSVNAQMRRTDRGFVIFEVNPRISSTTYFRHRLGFTDVLWWLDLLYGRPSEYRPRYVSAVGVRTLSAAFFDLEPAGGAPAAAGKASLSFDTERLALRVLGPGDVTPGYVDGLNDPEVNRYLVGVKAASQTMESVRAYVRRCLEAPADWLFGLFLKGSGGLIGTVRLHGVDALHQTCIAGVCLFDKAHWGKGYGPEAMRRVVRFAFEDLGLYYVEAGCYAENKGSERLFLKAGFEEKARFKDKFRLAGRPAEVIYLGARNPAFDAGPGRPRAGGSQSLMSSPPR